MRLARATLAVLVATGGCSPVVPGEADAVRVGAADFEVVPIVHGTFALGHAGEWVIVDPILRFWEHDSRSIPLYQAATWGPSEAEALIARDGRGWRQLS